MTWYMPYTPTHTCIVRAGTGWLAPIASPGDLASPIGKVCMISLVWYTVWNYEGQLIVTFDLVLELHLGEE